MVVIHPKNRKNVNARLKFATTRILAFIFYDKDKTPHNCYCFVSDLSKRGVNLYLDRKLNVHSVSLIAFETAESQPFRAKVIWVKSSGGNNPKTKTSLGEQAFYLSLRLKKKRNVISNSLGS